MWIKFKIVGFRERTNSLPSRRAIAQSLGATNKSDLPMAKQVKMFDGKAASEFVIHRDGADGIVFQFLPDHDSRYAALLQIAQHVNIHKQPIGKNDQRFYATIEQHLEIALKTGPVIMNIRQNG